MEQKRQLSEDSGLSDRVNALIIRMMDDKDPRLKKIIKVLNSTYYDAKAERPHDEEYATSRAYRDVFAFVDREGYFDLYGFIQKVDVQSFL